jgi:hypothetical protein
MYEVINLPIVAHSASGALGTADKPLHISLSLENTVGGKTAYHIRYIGSRYTFFKFR